MADLESIPSQKRVELDPAVKAESEGMLVKQGAVVGAARGPGGADTCRMLAVSAYTGIYLDCLKTSTHMQDAAYSTDIVYSSIIGVQSIPRV